MSGDKKFTYFRVVLGCRMALPRPPKFAFRNDSRFDDGEQSKFIILKFGETKNVTMVRRAFRAQFYPQNPRKVPQRLLFQRVIDRFLSSASVMPRVPKGLTPCTPEDVQRVKDYFTVNPKNHIRSAVTELGMSFGKILRKVLKLKPYRPHLTQVLSPGKHRVKTGRRPPALFGLLSLRKSLRKFCGQMRSGLCCIRHQAEIMMRSNGD